jgi:RNA recognition motif-containing protein
MQGMPPGQALILLPGPGADPNCLVASGLPWYVTERQCREDLARLGKVRYVRLYEDPLNGSSRGMALVRFDQPDAHRRALGELSAIGPNPVSLSEFHIHDLWNPLTAPPQLPPSHDPSRGNIAKNKVFGYGPKCLPRAVGHGDANTTTPDGMSQLAAARKKFRAEFDEMDEHQ